MARYIILWNAELPRKVSTETKVRIVGYFWSMHIVQLHIAQIEKPKNY